MNRYSSLECDVRGYGKAMESTDWLVVVEFPNSETGKSLTLFISISIISGALLVIFMIVVLRIIKKRVTNPISALETGIESAMRGEKRKVDIKSNDELGALGGAYNKLLEEIAASNAELGKMNRILENKIKKRTNELKDKLDELNNVRLAVMNMMEDMLEANEHLKDLDKAKSNFLNMISHELKTPLTAMSAHMEVINEMNPNPEDIEASSRNAIIRNMNQLKMLIENILEIARLESNKFELNFAKVDIAKIIDEIVSNLEILAENKNVKLVKDIEKLPAIVNDDARIKEIFNNLISNAVKFTEKGKIIISAKKHGKFILMGVKDSGIGIPKNKMKDLFTKFYQVDARLSRKYEGTGLGLSITKQLVELMGGKIWVESVEGKGTKFSFILPIKAKKIKVVKDEKDPIRGR
jgi:signal transduction histidine kinase